MSIIDVLQQRYSTIMFDPRPIEPEVINRIFEAARWASSASNTQPWRFIVAYRQNPDDFNRLLSLLNDGNKTWAANAPLLILAVAYNKNERGPMRWAMHDTGMATANLMLQAATEGLYSHVMGGFDAAKAKTIFDLPSDVDPVSVIALGHLASPDSVTEDIREKDKSRKVRTRKNIGEIVFNGKWGNAL